MTHTFRAMWPVVDTRRSWASLCTEAYSELGPLLRQAHAEPTGHGGFRLAASRLTPGSGNVTDWVLIYECPARLTPRGRRQRARASA